mgnify:FL=1
MLSKIIVILLVLAMDIVDGFGYVTGVSTIEAIDQLNNATYWIEESINF